jgi:hypothetical protein
MANDLLDDFAVCRSFSVILLWVFKTVIFFFLSLSFLEPFSNLLLNLF